LCIFVTKFTIKLNVVFKKSQQCFLCIFVKHLKPQGILEYPIKWYIIFEIFLNHSIIIKNISKYNIKIGNVLSTML